jgi:CRISPR-associated protein Cmr6
VPGYLSGLDSGIQQAPPGHRFLLYFPSCAEQWDVRYPKQSKKEMELAEKQGEWGRLLQYRQRSNTGWGTLNRSKRQALNTAAGMGKTASDLLSGIRARTTALLDANDWRREATLIAPLATGLGNPHPVENGFAFLSPYGVPYLAGSSVKGVLRRAAEELALFDNESVWRLSYVWALFGFDENSACLCDGADETGWSHAYRQWIEQVEAQGDPVLTAWKRAINRQLPKTPRNWQDATEPELLHGLLGEAGESLRRAIHWQGMIAFFDAFPDKGAQLAVDILNPHHKSYYEGNGTPHDAESPVPVFFLTVAPGASFTFSAKPIAGRDPLWQAIGGWKALLDAAFAHSCERLGFGAKTAVGYGAMERVTDAGQMATQSRSSWVDEKIKELSSKPGVKYDDALRGKSLAEAVRAIEDSTLRKKVLQDIVQRWKDRKWWDALAGKSAKEAKKIYEELGGHVQ